MTTTTPVARTTGTARTIKTKRVASPAANETPSAGKMILASHYNIDFVRADAFVGKRIRIVGEMILKPYSLLKLHICDESDPDDHSPAVDGFLRSLDTASMNELAGLVQSRTRRQSEGLPVEADDAALADRIEESGGERVYAFTIRNRSGMPVGNDRIDVTCRFDKTYKVGDGVCVRSFVTGYDSRTVGVRGRLVGVGRKYVTVFVPCISGRGGKNKRMDFDDFYMLNSVDIRESGAVRRVPPGVVVDEPLRLPAGDRVVRLDDGRFAYVWGGPTLPDGRLDPLLRDTAGEVRRHDIHFGMPGGSPPPAHPTPSGWRVAGIFRVAGDDLLRSAGDDALGGGLRSRVADVVFDNGDPESDGRGGRR